MIGYRLQNSYFGRVASLDKPRILMFT
uniref:Uncharacterized protein n=1 Tax=Arundo donax TaxID=35708 RepID=A0A0A9H8V0_ARUDO